MNGRAALIIGAGVFGASAALELARRGWSATIVEPGLAAESRGSSYDVSKVIRMDYGADDFYLEIMRGAMPRWEAWNRERAAEGLPPLYHRDGFLLMRRGPLEAGGYEFESRARLRARGLGVDAINADSLRARFPAWGRVEGLEGYFNPNAGWAESGAATLDLLRRARGAGARVIEGARLEALLERGSRVVGAALRGGERVEADLTILAAGAWSPALAPELARLTRPVGQAVVFFCAERPELYRPPGFSCWAADISRTGWYGFPALANGVVKVGRHGPGFEVDVERVLAGEAAIPPDHEAATREFLREWLPGLAGAPLAGSRVCLYCDSFDGHFIIDHHPGRPGLFVAAGGSGHAFKFAPVLGGLIADAVERVPRPELARFAWREPGGAAGADPGSGGGEAARWTGD